MISPFFNRPVSSLTTIELISKAEELYQRITRLASSDSWMDRYLAVTENRWLELVDVEILNRQSRVNEPGGWDADGREVTP